MPLVQDNINRVNRMIENILDQPIVIRVMSPVQPIANTLTTRYLEYAIPTAERAETARPVSYAVVDTEGRVAWEGDTDSLIRQPEHRRKDTSPHLIRRRPVSYSVVNASGNVIWEGDTDLLPGRLQSQRREA